MQATYDRSAIFTENAPLDPSFIQEAIKTMFRALPLDNEEAKPAQDRRFDAALLALSATHPRDEIEVMLGVQAIAAYHAAAACFRIGMNHHKPNGDSTRHITAACSAARTFDTLLKAIERRQAKPLAIPPGRPDAQDWTHRPSPSARIDKLAKAVQAGETQAPPPNVEWTDEQLAQAHEQIDQYAKEKENEGLDIANTEGILPGGGMIVPDDPTPQQQAYLARRMVLQLRREYAENVRKGSKQIPKIKPARPGDLIP